MKTSKPMKYSKTSDAILADLNKNGIFRCDGKMGFKLFTPCRERKCKEAISPLMKKGIFFVMNRQKEND